MFVLNLLISIKTNSIIASLSSEILDKYGMDRVFILSQSRQGDREFFKSFCQAIAEKLTKGKYNLWRYKKWIY